MAKQDSIKRIQYQKPEALELGQVAAIIGASCVSGETITPEVCISTGSGVGAGRSPSSRDQSDKFNPEDLFK
ncbi:MAG: hypothetical protein JXA42_09445 [Anaerolineales bacterium]|nr:hypothetical protein [Anaerolineales bacterium]